LFIKFKNTSIICFFILLTCSSLLPDVKIDLKVDFPDYNF